MVRAIPPEATALEETAIQEFRTRLRGELIGPGDPDYDAARRVHNGMIDRCRLRCKSEPVAGRALR
jgi:hypothetical protein